MPTSTQGWVEPEFQEQPPESPRGELQVFVLGGSKPLAAFLKQLPAGVSQTLVRSENGFEFHPSFSEVMELKTLTPVTSAELLQSTLAKMKLAFADESTIADQARVLHVARAHRGQNGDADSYEPEQTKLLYVSLRRRVGDWITDGPGSRFTTAVGADGTMRGAVYHWRTKQSVDKTAQALDPQIVKDIITKQIQQVVAKHPELPSHAIVRHIRFAYYDADRRYLQPVYRFVAEFTPASPSVSKGRTSFYVGYVPLDPQLGEVPTSLTDEVVEPSEVKTVPSDSTPIIAPTGPDIAVGRYIARGNNAGFIRDSDAFLRGLKTPGATLTFADTQNFLARRFMFTSRKDYFANLVDLALVEAHGSPWTLITYRDFASEVKLNGDVPTTGYGTAGGGRLKHLIVHSCRVVRTGVDTYYGQTHSEWAADYWDLFNGLSSIVGYRSSMFIDDGAGSALADNLARGEAVVPAWFGAVASLNIYGPNSWESTFCANPEPLGRASAIAVCDEGSKATVKDASTPRPTCLEAWWLGDEILASNSAKPDPTVEVPVPGVCPDEGDTEGGYPCCGN